MIKFENTEVIGWEHAIRGMRNPMNSWEKSDSGKIYWNGTWYTLDPVIRSYFTDYGINLMLGPNDLDLMKRLRNAGTDHRKFMRMIAVYVDITAPLYWWSEYDTYKVGTVANSCSKMHKLLAKPFEMGDFSFDKLPGYKKEIIYFVPDFNESNEMWKPTIEDPYYEVSNFGRVRHDGRVLSGSIHKDGYMFVNIRGKQCARHRLVAEVFVENPENKPFVNHIDGNKQNNSVDNLEWCTQSENTKHAYDSDLQPKGLSTYKGKFTSEEREQIKNEWDSGAYSRRQLAKKYGVSHTCINDIINDKYKYAERTNVYEEVARPIVDTLNELRDSWLNCDNINDKKQIWYAILQLLPSSYNQKRTVMMNYEVLANIYKSRKNHKLDEWAEHNSLLKKEDDDIPGVTVLNHEKEPYFGFCDWIKTLPYSELITGGVD